MQVAKVGTQQNFGFFSEIGELLRQVLESTVSDDELTFFLVETTIARGRGGIQVE